MKLSDTVVDPQKIEEGDWVGEKYGTPIPELGNICLKVQGVGNAKWKRLQRTLSDAVPRKNRPGGRLKQEEEERITSICLRDASILDWENVEGDGKLAGRDGKVFADGEVVPFDKKAANQLLTDPVYRRFRDGVIWAATVVGDIEAGEQEDIAGN